MIAAGLFPAAGLGVPATGFGTEPPLGPGFLAPALVAIVLSSARRSLRVLPTSPPLTIFAATPRSVLTDDSRFLLVPVVVYFGF